MSETILERPDQPAPASHEAASGGRASGAGRYLTFTLGGEIYTLEILDVSEIIEFRALTVVPMMPSFIRGVINLRGRVLPVVDLAARFGQQPTVVGRRTGIIVVEPSSRRAAAVGSDSALGLQGIGIMVDSVNKVVHLGEDDIKAPPAFGAGIRSDFISGMAKFDGSFIVVLDIDKLLTFEEIVGINQSLPPSTGSPDDSALDAAALESDAV